MWLNETYWFSGACLLRVAVLIAVMIWRVMQSSANERNDVAIGAEVADGLVEADQALLDEVVRIAAGEEVGARLEADEAVVAADDGVHRALVTVAGSSDHCHLAGVAPDTRLRPSHRCV